MIDLIQKFFYVEHQSFEHSTDLQMKNIFWFGFRLWFHQSLKTAIDKIRAEVRRYEHKNGGEKRHTIGGRASKFCSEAPRGAFEPRMDFPMIAAAQSIKLFIEQSFFFFIYYFYLTFHDFHVMRKANLPHQGLS